MTDGRFSGASKGPAIGHISPEAAQGGPIALIEENDLIEIDIPQRILRVIGINGEKCSEEEVQRVFNERRKALPPFKSRYTHGVLKRFTQTAHSPCKAVTWTKPNPKSLRYATLISSPCTTQAFLFQNSPCICV